MSADTYGPKYRTRLPVWLDASSNGLQHLALMVRDAKLAAMVNLKTAAKERRGLAALGPDDDSVPEDVYQILGAHETRTLHANQDARSQYWYEHRENLRDLLKRPIMTLPYGVTKRGMLDQIKDGCAELGIAPSFGALVCLRDHIWCAIEERLPGAMKARECIQAIAKDCLERGGPAGAEGGD